MKLKWQPTKFQMLYLLHARILPCEKRKTFCIYFSQKFNWSGLGVSLDPFWPNDNN